jgi:ABC-2 type transport system ATP-binding protein
MATIEVEHIVKNFGTMCAVNDVSFQVEKGEIFGLLGPNGAGKTTTIRIILDLFKADSGKVSILGGPIDEEKKNHIGYLPEERGLYQDIPLERCIVYLATLKGLSPEEAKRRMDGYLERFDLSEYRKKKVKELSKGMQQKAQLIVTLIHEPELLIIDEPFSALDPINTQMVKDLLKEEREKGTSIVMSTHQMNQVEELCDRLVLINSGKVILYGELGEIRHRYAGEAVDIRSPNTLPDKMKGVDQVLSRNGGYRLTLQPGITYQEVLKGLLEENINLEQFEIAIPTLDEIFIRVVKGDNENDA